MDASFARSVQTKIRGALAQASAREPRRSEFEHDAFDGVMEVNATRGRVDGKTHLHQFQPMFPALRANTTLHSILEATDIKISAKVGKALDGVCSFVLHYSLMPMKRGLSVWFLAVAIASVCGFVCGCNTVCDTVSDFFRDRTPVDASVVATWWDGPRIRPGVKLLIQVGTPAAAPTVMDVIVDQNGDVTLPLLLQDPVACDGLTLEAFKQKLVKAYSKYYRQPMVTVTFAPYDGNTGVSPWGTVTVLGEVSRPGPVNMPSTMDLTVTKVLQAAGGCKPFADKTSIRVTRCDRDGNQTRTYVNLNEIGKDGRVDKDMALRAGDVVWVPETWY